MSFHLNESIFIHTNSGFVSAVNHAEHADSGRLMNALSIYIYP